MNKKTFIKIFLVIFVIGIFLIGNYFYQDKKKTNFLICELKTTDKDYKEILTFQFLSDVLFTYDRDETVFTNNLQEDLKVFTDIEATAPKINYFSYHVNYDKTTIYVNTHIEAFHIQEFYNEYIKGKGLTFTLTEEEIANVLKDEYNCRRVRKKVIV